jgi:hypothetical protein
MSCCGRLRSATTPPQPVAVSGPEPRGSALAGATGMIELRYLDRVPISVTGPRTRLVYQFSGAAPVTVVDIRDARILLRTRYFRPAR